MSSRRYTTEFVIKGDSTSAVQASRDLQRANSDLAREIENTERRSEEMAASFESVSMHAQRLATVTAAATAATGAMVVSQTRNIAEQAAFARAVGVSVQTLQQWEFAAKAAGMQSGAIGDIFKDTAEKIGDFVNTGGGEAADLFEVLNLNIRDLMDLSPDKQLLAVANAFDEVGNRGAKIAFIEGLGNDATLLLPLLENNAELLREQLDIADRIGVSIPQSDVDSIESANQALNELNELANGFATTVAANFAPSIVAMSQGTQELVGDLGGMSEVVDKVATGTLLVSGLLGGRLASSMATATAATLAKLSADRSARLADAAASAANAKRTAETLRIAQSEQLAAQRAFESARAIAIATGNTTLRTKAITQMAAANQRAIAAEAAHTAAVNANSAAMGRASVVAQGMAGASRALSGALALVGGPLGAAVLAGAGIYAFREELGLTIPQIDANTTAVDKLTAGLDNMNEAAAQLTLTSLVGRLAEVRAQAEATAEEITKVGQIEGDGGGGFLGVDVTAQTDAVRELGATSNETQQEAANLEAAIALVETRLGKLGERNREVTPTITSVGDAAEAAARKAQQAAEAQAKALVGLQQEMDPLLADHAEYVERLAVLDRALAEGTISEEAYGEAVRWSAEQYQRAATGAEEYEKQTKTLVSTYDRHYQKAQQLQEALEQVNQRWRNDPENAAQYARMIEGIREEMQQLALDADPAAQEMARAWEEASNRIDETFADAFAGAFDSFDDFTDQLLDGFKRLLAELAYQATLKPIVVQFTQQMGGALGIPGVGGQGRGAGGFNLGSIGSLKNGWDTVSGLWGAGSAASTAAAGYGAAGWAGSATGAYSGWAGSAAAGAAQAGGGLMGAASAAMPWVGGALLVDNVLGLGIADGIVKGISSLFGGGKTAPKFELATVGQDVDPGRRGLFENYGEGVYSRGALGTVGFYDPNTARLEETFDGFDNAKAFLDGITALDNAMVGAVANLDNGAEKTQAMASAAQAVRLNAGDAAGIANQLATRTLAVVDVLDGDFSASLRGLGLDAEQLTGRVVQAANAMQLLDASSDRLNLQFDASAAGALRAADSIAQMAGGVDQLASLQNSYYTAFFSDAERAADLQQDVAASLRAMGLALPSTHEGFRQLVEQQNRLTESGQRNYVQLLQLAGPFDQLQTLLEQTGSGVDVFADRLSQLNGEISTLENEVRSAYAAFEKQSFDQRLQLLGLLGDEQAALALQRERELQGIDPLLQETQRRIWAMEDEAAAQQAATQAGQEYARSLAQVNDQLSSTFNGISQWVDQQSATGGTPGANLVEARTQLDRQLELARSGDRAAMQSITQYAERVLQANEAYNASGPAGQALRNEVLAALEELPSQVTAEEYLAQEIRDALQAVVISAMPTDERLAVELSRELTRLDTNQLTAAQVRSALAPHATDAEINRLIREVDANGDGIITKQELANQRLAGLASGIGSTLKPMFDSIDLDASGLIDWDEFYGAFQGLASDAELRRIFWQLDEDGSGTISRLEALNRSSEGTEGNTQTLEERARDQLQELGGLVSEMTRTTDQFVGLNSGISSLSDSINALGVAQAEVARIEKERAAAEKAERERIQRERDAALIDRYTSAADEYQALMRKANAADSNYATRQQNLSAAERAFQTAQNREGGNSGETVKVAQRFSSLQQAQAEINRRRAQGWNNSADTIETYWQLQQARQAAQNLVDPRPFLSAAEELERVMQNIEQTAKQTGVTLPKVNGSHATGLWSVPFDGYLAELHREEMVVPAKSANLLRELPDRGLPVPDTPLPQFPALGQNDVLQVLRDVKRELVETRKQNQRLQEENNRHAAAAVAVQQAGFNGQINEQKKSNLALDDMSAAARLEASR